MIDLTAARTFMDTHARVLDRAASRAAPRWRAGRRALQALRAYRNADGGFGWALEADLRAPSSQPAGALHAFEVLEEAAPATSDMAPALCDWLESATLDDGGLPFSVAGAATPGTARGGRAPTPRGPRWHITAAVVEAGHAVAAHDPRVASHPWLARATAFCRRRSRRTATASPPTSCASRSACSTRSPTSTRRPAELEHLAALVPPSGELPVEGGLEDERLRALDLSPRPGRPLRDVLPTGTIEGDLDRLEQGQQDDGGWLVEWQPASPGAAFEWRGTLTLRAIALLRAHGRLDA